MGSGTGSSENHRERSGEVEQFVGIYPERFRGCAFPLRVWFATLAAYRSTIVKGVSHRHVSVWVIVVRVIKLQQPVATGHTINTLISRVVPCRHC